MRYIVPVEFEVNEEDKDKAEAQVREYLEKAPFTLEIKSVREEGERKGSHMPGAEEKT